MRYSKTVPFVLPGTLSSSIHGWLDGSAGLFRQGRFDGAGRHVLSDGETYKGHFVGGWRHGDGELTTESVHYTGGVGLRVIAAGADLHGRRDRRG